MADRNLTIRYGFDRGADEFLIEDLAIICEEAGRLRRHPASDAHPRRVPSGKHHSLTRQAESLKMPPVRLHPYTPWIISVGAVICGVDGLFMVLRIPNRTWGDWVAYVGGMILAGALIGFLVALLTAICSKYFWLPSRSSQSVLRNSKKKIFRK